MCLGLLEIGQNVFNLLFVETLRATSLHPKMYTIGMNWNELK